MAAKRPEQPCKSCGAITTSQVRLCRACKPNTARRVPEPTYADGLNGGRWTPGPGGVRRWVPSEVA